MLVATLDSHVRLMDLTTGKMLNDFQSHSNTSYRCRACFGHAEATVLCGDENGQIWAWDLVDVRQKNTYSYMTFINNIHVSVGNATATQSSAQSPR